MDDFELHAVPRGYDVSRSVHKVDAEMALSQDGRPKEVSPVSTSLPQAPSNDTPGQALDPGSTKGNPEPQGSDKTCQVPSSGALGDAEVAPKSNESVQLQAGELGTPPKATFRIAEATNSADTFILENLNQEMAPNDSKGTLRNTHTEQDAPREGGSLASMYAPSSLLPQNNPTWTPGIVRLTAMKATKAAWDDIHHHVECAGDTPEEKLRVFEEGMIRHATTGVRLFFIEYCIITFILLVLDDQHAYATLE